MVEATMTTLDRVTAFTHELVVALVTLQLHDRNSELMRSCCKEMTDELSALFAAGADDPLRIAIGDNCLFHRDELLLGSSLQAGRFIQLCHERHIRSIEFDSRTTSEEILALLEFLNIDDKDGFLPQNLRRMLDAAGIINIDVRVEDNQDPQGAPAGSASESVAQYQALADCLQESHVAAFHGEQLEIDKACGLVEAALSQVNTPAGLLSLASSDFIDTFTVGHSVRVALLALHVATVGRASRHDLIRVGTAALLHDIGKSRIPQEILFKKGRLTPEEWEVIQRHSRLGGEVLLEQPQLDQTTIGAAFCHHMTPAGGYPNPAVPFEPSGVSKLVRVCDVFEALTSVRPYKQALSPIEAYAVMFRDVGGFDPAWLQFFADALGLYPQGTFLTLATGEVGLVTGRGKGPTQPQVKITSEDGEDVTVIIGEEHEGIVRWIATGHESTGAGGGDSRDHGHDHDHGDEGGGGIPGCCKRTWNNACGTSGRTGTCGVATCAAGCCMSFSSWTGFSSKRRRCPTSSILG